MGKKKGKDLPLLRTSERAAFKRCPQRWFWGYREGLVPRYQKKDARWFGTGIHLAFAEWYIPGTERGRDLRETWEEYVGESYDTLKISGPEEEAEFESDLELGKIMLTEHLNRYGDDPNWEVIYPEHTFAVLIRDPENPKKAIVRYVGTFDAIYINKKTGEVWLMDHKSAKAIDTGHLFGDEQAGSYVAVAPTQLVAEGILKKGEDIAGIMYNFLAKRKPDSRPRDENGRYLNKDGSISKVQPPKTLHREPVKKTAFQNKKQIERIGIEAALMEPFREEGQEAWLMKNFTRDCKWDCDFYELCSVDETGGDVEAFKKASFRVEDPYMDHRSGAKNTKESLAAMKALKGLG